MILDWIDTASKYTRFRDQFKQGVEVIKLSNINFRATGQAMYEGDTIQTPEQKGEIECHDGVYLVIGNWIALKPKPPLHNGIRIEGAALFSITGKKLKYHAYLAENWPLRMRDTAAQCLEVQPDPLDQFTEEELEKALDARREAR